MQLKGVIQGLGGLDMCLNFTELAKQTHHKVHLVAALEFSTADGVCLLRLLRVDLNVDTNDPFPLFSFTPPSSDGNLHHNTRGGVTFCIYT